ncbi:hypothetical protein [Streptomyces noursei]|uniref:hypothetical protein n=1 Tax=Streptomyces noursei TaxID=1971 RepID=UPI0016766682|nr:hypothetical protein [Streptomyces noursei]MCZ1013628.1 hypothetical protein [Streptomyces noursei]GGX25313.1 hypothetical protein GCM10010341_53190 [Streptomyces noursei]
MPLDPSIEALLDHVNARPLPRVIDADPRTLRGPSPPSSWSTPPPTSSATTRPLFPVSPAADAAVTELYTRLKHQLRGSARR